MKRTLLLLTVAAGFLFTSCNQGVSTETHQRIVDSLVQLIPPGAKSHLTNMAAQQQYTIAPIADFMVLKAGANKQIQEWHTTLKNKVEIKWDVNKNRTAFMVPRNTLDTLINSLNCPFVVFYLGIDKEGTGAMSLYYTGVEYVNKDPSQLTEIDIKNAAGESCVFDQTFPCPKCEKIGIHTQSSDVGGLPPSTIISWVLDDSPGKISPVGNVVSYKDTSVTYTFTPNPGYEIEKLIIDDSEIKREIPTKYTFNNVKGSHNISVKFKQKAQ
jgi:hypothetical protein